MTTMPISHEIEQVRGDLTAIRDDLIDEAARLDAGAEPSEQREIVAQVLGHVRELYDLIAWIEILTLQVEPPGDRS